MSPFQAAARSAAAFLLLALAGCSSSSKHGPEVPIRAAAWSAGTCGIVTNGNVIIAGGDGAGSASVDILGMPWKSVTWEAGSIVVGRVEPRFLRTFALSDPLPWWTAQRFPAAALAPDGRLRAQLAPGVEVTIETGPAPEAAP